MKKVIQLYLIIFIVALTGCTGKTQKSSSNAMSASSDTGKAVLAFREYEHQFGKVNEGEKVGCIFTFDNKGTSDLVILSATTTCGCTVPDYDRKPVSPGKTGKLEVVFDTSGRNGIQSKVITVRSNASNPVVLLKITAEVINSNNN
jgi:hypothetical protein